MGFKFKKLNSIIKIINDFIIKVKVYPFSDSKLSKFDNCQIVIKH